MLKILYGVAGVGKTDIIIKQLKQTVKDGKKAMLIVPEQFSFETEGNMLKSLCDGEFFEISILSFSRLCDKIFACYGGVQELSLTKSEKSLMLMKTALMIEDMLILYKRQIFNKSFISKMLLMIDEIKNADIIPGEIEKYFIDDSQNILSEKISDIGNIYTYYQTLTADYAPDTADKIIRAVEILQNNLKNDDNYFSNYNIFIDGFSGFTQVQLRLLEHMLINSESVTITMCCNSLNDTSQGFGVFSMVQDQAKKIIALAKNNNITVKTPIKMTENKRFKNKDLIDLEHNFLQKDKEKIQKIPQNIHINFFDDVYKEAEFVCAVICKKVKEQGFRFNDFIIITRNLPQISDIYQNSFEKYDIPYFLDRREDVASKTIFSFIAALLDMINYGFRTEDVLTYAKTGAIAVSTEEIARLENYCYVWQIKASMWKSNFVCNPDGLTGQWSESQQESLQKINQTRKILIDPVLEFLDKYKTENTVENICKGLYELTEKINAFENLEKQSNIIDAHNSKKGEFQKEFIRVWNTFVELLDKVNKIFADTRMDLKRFASIFESAASYCDLGVIPNSIDQAIIGQAERIRADGRKCCFITGLNQGVFPIEQPDFGLLSGKERERIISKGIMLSGTDFDFARNEDFYAYCAMTAPSEQLYLSYPLSDRQYNKLFPSIYIKEVMTIFPNIPKTKNFDDDPLICAQNNKTALGVYGQMLGNNTKEAATIARVVETKKEISVAARQIKKAQSMEAITINDIDVTKKLFGEKIKISSSKIERFSSCKFAFFLQYAVGIKKLQKAEITPLESGSMIHYVLCEYIKHSEKKNLIKLDEAVLKNDVKKIVNTYCDERLIKMQNLSAKQKNMLNKIINALCEIIIKIGEEFEQSQFEPVDYELDISTNGDVLPIVLQTSGGEEIIVEGKVDRVDILEKNGIKYIRIVDYKSGKKDFKLNEVFYGMNMQMLIYMFSLWQNGKRRYGDILPAGILYFPANSNIISSEIGDSQEKIEKNRKKKYRMDGLILDDYEIIEAMEKDIKGVYIPVKKTKDGIDNSIHLADLEQLGALKGFVEKQILNMAQSLYSGDIDCQVAMNEKSVPCDYCPYYSVCLNEGQENHRAVDDIEKNDFYRLIEQDN